MPSERMELVNWRKSNQKLVLGVVAWQKVEYGDSNSDLGTDFCQENHQNTLLVLEPRAHDLDCNSHEMASKILLATQQTKVHLLNPSERGPHRD